MQYSLCCALLLPRIELGFAARYCSESDHANVQNAIRHGSYKTGSVLVGSESASPLSPQG